MTFFITRYSVNMQILIEPKKKPWYGVTILFAYNIIPGVQHSLFGKHLCLTCNFSS